MPIVVCSNTKCKHISKRRKRFLNGLGKEVLCHTCTSKLISMIPLGIGDDSVEYMLGYQPYECLSGRVSGEE